MYRLIGISVFAIAVCFAGAPASAGKYSGPGLSAELVIRDPKLGEGRYTGRYYFDRGGYRMEIEGRTRFKSFVFNSFHRYFVSVGSNRRTKITEDDYGAFEMRFGDAPCAGFTSAIKVGSDSKAGRELQVWRCARPKQPLLDTGFSTDHKATVWYDGELKHFIRMEANNGVAIELKKIVPGRQSPSLFNVPAEAGPVSATGRVADVESVEQ